MERMTPKLEIPQGHLTLRVPLTTKQLLFEIARQKGMTFTGLMLNSIATYTGKKIEGLDKTYRPKTKL